jgi:hypothetical protein
MVLKNVLICGSPCQNLFESPWDSGCGFYARQVCVRTSSCGCGGRVLSTANVTGTACVIYGAFDPERRTKSTRVSMNSTENQISNSVGASFEQNLHHDDRSFAPASSTATLVVSLPFLTFLFQSLVIPPNGMLLNGEKVLTYALWSVMTAVYCVMQSIAARQDDPHGGEIVRTIAHLSRCRPANRQR